MQSDLHTRFKYTSIVLVFLSCVWAVLRVGLGQIPGLDSAADNAFGWPNVSLSEFSAFAATSPTGALTYTVLGQRNPHVFLLIHVVAVVIAISLAVMWVRNMSDPEKRNRSTRLVVLSPWVAMLFIFLGSYDPFTIIGFTLLLWSWQNRYSYWSFAAGIFLGFQHFEQAFLGIVGAALVLMAVGDSFDRRYASRRHIIVSLTGVVLGKVLLTLILTMGSDTGAFGRSSYWTLEWIRISVVTSINFGAVFLLSLFAGLWALVIYVYLGTPRKRKHFLILAFLVCFLPAFITLDHTRVFVMVSFMGLMLLIVSVSQRGFKLPRRAGNLIEVMAWIVVPISVWVGMDGSPYLYQVGSLDQLIIFMNNTFR